MKAQENGRQDRAGIARVAESANRRFVGLAGILFRAVTWRRPFRGRDREDAPEPGDDARGDGPRPGRKPAVPFGVLSLDPKALAALAKKVDDIVKRSVRAQYPRSPKGSAAPIERDDEILQRKLRELFHEDPWHRLAAVRWIRENRCKEALSTLEGVLSIEESQEVRNEIGRALAALGAGPSKNKGEMRCSRSSEVSL